jgi:predicted RNA-binding protein with PIN domain
VAYLIDGYNLLFAYLGVPPSRKLSKALERARRRLLELLRSGHIEQPGDVTVIFDAAHAPPGAPAELDHHGIHVAFAVHHERADDLIETLIRQTSTPRQLTVVTDDRRIQQAARRRHCTVRGCADYLEALERSSPERSSKPEPSAAKPQTVSGEDMQHWLGAFAELERDSAMRELSNLDDFGAVEDLPDE